MHVVRCIFFLLAALLLVLGLSRLRFDADVLNLLPGRLPAVEALKIHQEHFTDGRELLVTLQAADAGTTEEAARSLAEHLRDTDLAAAVIWQAPWDEHPGQGAELLAYLWYNQPPRVFAELTNRFAPETLSATLTDAREQLAVSFSPEEIARLSYDPLGLMELPPEASWATPAVDQRQFASADGRFRVLFIEAGEEPAHHRNAIKWLEDIRSQVLRWQSENDFEDVEFAFTGGPAFLAEIGGGMERDMRRSVLGTVFIVAILFWLMHRRLGPLLWLVALLGLVLGVTMALGGLLFGSLNVVSAGFAAILLGLAVDYGMVLYQEARDTPNVGAARIQRTVGPSIGWAALTTGAAFAALNFSSLPGLSELGSLVAIGVLVAAFVMLAFFLPPLMRRGLERGAPAPRVPDSDSRRAGSLRSAHRWESPLAWTATILIALAATLTLLRTGVDIDPSAEPLRPIESHAYDTLRQMQLRLGRGDEPHWLIFGGRDEDAISRRMRQARGALEQARADNRIADFTLPDSLWPQPDAQTANRPVAVQLVADREKIRAEILAHGFTERSLAVTEQMIDVWNRAARSPSAFWPTNTASRWVLDKVAARHDGRLFARGLVYPATDGPAAEAEMNALASEFIAPNGRVWLANWESLGPAVFKMVAREVWVLGAAILGVLLLALGLAFRRVNEVLLSLAVLGFAGVSLWAIMGILGWSWNLLNLMALPLLLGLCIDYNIHVQLGLRRHGGNVREVRHTIGRALLLCAATTIAAFGSLGFSNNAGLASLGKVCAVGIACAYFTAVFLLPAWWNWLNGKTPSPARSPVPSTSLLYKANLWSLGLALVQKLPPQTCRRIARAAANLYWHACPHRREVVIENLMPALDNDRAAAGQAGKRLFGNFAQKLLDLWRYESGQSVDDLFEDWTGWDNFLAARENGRGVLLLTPHLGNWEFGAPLLAKRGVNLLVITQEEPDRRLTEMRQQSRARWGIDTLVIGRDPFAFVEVIKRLESGSTVALLVDRPPAGSEAPVQLFGRPFDASIAGAELARASGCALLPVYLPRGKTGYTAHALPAIHYNRAALRDTEARGKLTREIMRTFEPVIREHIDQWYHFVPVWESRAGVAPSQNETGNR